MLHEMPSAIYEACKSCILELIFHLHLQPTALSWNCTDEPHIIVWGAHGVMIIGDMSSNPGRDW